MKILHCQYMSASMLDGSLSPGGVAVYVNALTSALEHKGHEVQMLQIAEKPQISGEDQTIRFPTTYGPLKGLKQSRHLRELLEQSAPDIVHLHSPYTVISPVLVRQIRTLIPTVATLHDVRPFCFHASRRFVPTGELCERRKGVGCATSGCYAIRSPADILQIPRALLVENWSLREWQKLPRIMVLSRYMRSLAIQHGFDPQRIDVVPMFSRVVGNSPSSRQGSVPTIIFMGRLVVEKGVFVLLDALDMLRDCSWKAVFVGAGPEGDALKARADRLGLGSRIQFTGHLDDRQRDDRLQAADILVLPSIIAEGLGLVAMEAFCFGKPVVSFGLGGLGDLVVDGVTGLVAMDGSTADLALKIRTLLERPDLARTLGRHGRELVMRECRPEDCVRLVTRAYESAVKSRS